MSASMRQTRPVTGRFCDTPHAGLSGVAMVFEHVMILQLV